MNTESKETSAESNKLLNQQSTPAPVDGTQIPQNPSAELPPEAAQTNNTSSVVDNEHNPNVLQQNPRSKKRLLLVIIIAVLALLALGAVLTVLFVRSRNTNSNTSSTSTTVSATTDDNSESKQVSSGNAGTTTSTVGSAASTIVDATALQDNVLKTIAASEKKSEAKLVSRAPVSSSATTITEDWVVEVSGARLTYTVIITPGETGNASFKITKK